MFCFVCTRESSDVLARHICFSQLPPKQPRDECWSEQLQQGECKDFFQVLGFITRFFFLTFPGFRCFCRSFLLGSIFIVITLYFIKRSEKTIFLNINLSHALSSLQSSPPPTTIRTGITFHPVSLSFHQQPHSHHFFSSPFLSVFENKTSLTNDYYNYLI